MKHILVNSISFCMCISNSSAFQLAVFNSLSSVILLLFLPSLFLPPFLPPLFPLFLFLPLLSSSPFSLPPPPLFLPLLSSSPSSLPLSLPPSLSSPPTEWSGKRQLDGSNLKRMWRKEETSGANRT